MIDFKSLKKTSKSEFNRLTEKINQLNESEFKKDDERFWQLTVDKAGNGEAVIRFLPPVDGEEVPFIRYWDHGFKGPGGWYIENSRTSLKDPVTGKAQADPLSEYNSERWAEGEKSPGRDFVSGTQGNPGSKRRLHYVSNIYVIKDYANSENNGKVFLFKYGKKIFDHLNALMNPEFESKQRVNPFAWWEGANFILRAQKKHGYRNYDASEWMTPGPLGEDEMMEEVWKALHPLQPFLDPKLFKSYEELKRRLDRVLKINTSTSTATTVEDEESVKPTKTTAPAKEVTPPWQDDDEEGDADLEAFKKLAVQD